MEGVHVRHLRKYGDAQFSYNASGIRTRKIADGKISKFYYAGDKLLAEERAEYKKPPENNYVCGDVLTLDDPYCYSEAVGQVIEYFHGATGITGFRTEGKTYYYRKNLQGDIVQIVESSGIVKAEYAYDAWGNHKVYAIKNNERIDITENIL